MLFVGKNIRGVGFCGIILCGRRDAPWHVSCGASVRLGEMLFVGKNIRGVGLGNAWKKVFRILIIG